MVCAECGYGNMLVRRQRYGDKVILSYWCAKCNHRYDVTTEELSRG